jgi:hypothetical protein
MTRCSAIGAPINASCHMRESFYTSRVYLQLGCPGERRGESPRRSNERPVRARSFMGPVACRAPLPSIAIDGPAHARSGGAAVAAADALADNAAGAASADDVEAGADAESAMARSVATSSRKPPSRSRWQPSTPRRIGATTKRGSAASLFGDLVWCGSASWHSGSRLARVAGA